MGRPIYQFEDPHIGIPNSTAVETNPVAINEPPPLPSAPAWEVPLFSMDPPGWRPSMPFVRIGRMHIVRNGIPNGTTVETIPVAINEPPPPPPPSAPAVEVPPFPMTPPGWRPSMPIVHIGIPNNTTTEPYPVEVPPFPMTPPGWRPSMPIVHIGIPNSTTTETNPVAVNVSPPPPSALAVEVPPFPMPPPSWRPGVH